MEGGDVLMLISQFKGCAVLLKDNVLVCRNLCRIEVSWTSIANLLSNGLENKMSVCVCKIFCKFGFVVKIFQKGNWRDNDSLLTKMPKVFAFGRSHCCLAPPDS